MDHLQLASQGSPTTPSKMLTQHTGDPLGGRTYQRQCSEGRQQKQLHHYIDATPTSVDWTYRLHAQHTSPQTDLFRTTSRPTCGSSVTVDDWEFIALERRLWNEVTHKGTATYESELRHVANSKRQLQKERRSKAPTSSHTDVASTAISGPTRSPLRGQAYSFSSDS